MPLEQAKDTFKLLEPHSQDAFETPVEVVNADLSIPSTYVICEKDQGVPPFVQEMLSSGMNIERVAGGHFSTVTQTESIVDIIKRAADA